MSIHEPPFSWLIIGNMMLGLLSLIPPSVVRVVARLTWIEFNSGESRRGKLECKVHSRARILHLSNSHYGKSPNAELFHGCLPNLVFRGERHTNEEPGLIYIMVPVASIHH